MRCGDLEPWPAYGARFPHRACGKPFRTYVSCSIQCHRGMSLSEPTPKGSDPKRDTRQARESGALPSRARPLFRALRRSKAPCLSAQGIGNARIARPKGLFAPQPSSRSRCCRRTGAKPARALALRLGKRISGISARAVSVPLVLRPVTRSPGNSKANPAHTAV
jgi:hypothetical protein